MNRVDLTMVKAMMRADMFDMLADDVSDEIRFACRGIQIMDMFGIISSMVKGVDKKVNGYEEN